MHIFNAHQDTSHLRPNMSRRPSAVSSIFLIAMAFPSIHHDQKQSMPTAQIESTVRTQDITFSDHNFGAYCFNASGCSVLYANRYIVNNPDDKSSPPPPEGYLHRLAGSHIAIRNFPRPAVVKWHSKDGTFHEAHVNIADIFRDEKILHNSRLSDVPSDIYIGPPDIILVINDRTISIYMKAHLPIRAPRDPSKPLSNFTSNLILASTRSY